MPQFKSENLEKVYLPSTQNETNEDDKAWVVIDTNLTAAAMIGLKTGDGGAASLHMVARAIKDWNFTDSQGGKVPITDENVAHLSFADFGFLSSKIESAAVAQTAGVPESLKET